MANYHEKVIDHYENPRCLNSWWITETTTLTGTLAWTSQTCMEQECGQDGPQVKEGGHWPCGCSSLWRCHEAADWGWPPFQLFNLSNKDIVTLVLWRLTMMGRLWMPSSRPLAVALLLPPPGQINQSTLLSISDMTIVHMISTWINIFSIKSCYWVDQGEAVDWCRQDQEQWHCQGFPHQFTSF